MRVIGGSSRHWAAGCTTLSLLILLCFAATPATVVRAQSAQGTPPTVGEIVVDRFDCETRQLWFHVPVANLPLDPSLQTLGHSVQGPDAANPTATYRPNLEVASYTGNVYLSSRAPVTELDPLEEDLTLQVVVYVGLGDNNGATDSSSASFTTNCREAEAPANEVVQELVALLIAILTSLLGDGGVS
jgi:hypothetical protein